MDRKPGFQRLELFTLPARFRGRSGVYVQFWWLVQTLFFKPLPQICFPLRRFILRAFGARIGPGVRIRPGVEVTYPWKVSIGENSWIGDNVTLYSLGDISIGDNTVVSQNSYICAADHDYSDPAFAIRARPVIIEDEVWVASDVWVGPGVTIGAGAVIGARSTVMRDQPGAMVCAGSPCKPIKPRVLREALELRT
jgi:putative colanic acid biosynthesis acetyltransferase WcaF